MDRSERLQFCKNCQKRLFDFNRGILCSLTNEFADFEESCADFVLDEKLQALETFRKEQDDKELRKRQGKKDARRIRKARKAKVMVKRVPDRLRRIDLPILFGVGFLTLFLVKLINYISFGYSVSGLSGLSYLLIFISSVLILVLRKREEPEIQVFGDWKFSLLYAAILTFFATLYKHLVSGSAYNFLIDLLGVFIVLGIVSLFSFVLALPISLAFKRFRGAGKQAGRIIFISGIVLFPLLMILDGDFFIRKEKLHWNAQQPVRAENFRAYPNYLTGFSAAISSAFEYEVLGEAYDSVLTETFMYTHHSWINRKYQHSDDLLRHEQYHFNLSEVYARKFRKMLASMSGEAFDETSLQNLYHSNLGELNRMQDNYDDDCDHGLITERQKDWEYIIDSMLNAYQYYAFDNSASYEGSRGNVRFFRDFDIDGGKRFIGRYEIDSATAALAPHYTFVFEKGRLKKLAFYKGQHPALDEYYEVAEIRFSYGPGREERTFFDTRGLPMRDNDGVYGRLLVKNADKLVATNLDRQGRAMEDRQGVTVYIADLDQLGRRANVAFFDVSGRQISNNSGEYIINYKYDRRGNLTERGNYNKDLELIENSDGYAFTRYFYDENDRHICTLLFDSKFSQFEDEVGIAAWYGNYDGYGNLIRYHYELADGSFYIDSRGVAISYLHYDQYGNIVGERYYGPNKNLIINEQGVGRLEREYDSISRLTVLRNFDAYDKPLNDGEGRCLRRYSYNPEGLLSEKQEFGLDSLGAFSHLKTYTYLYDAHQNIIEERWLDEAGQALADSNGVSILRFAYDRAGNRIRKNTFNTSGEAVAYSGDVYESRFSFNTLGLISESSHFDADGKLAENKDGIARELSTYNDRGQRTSVRYFDREDKPVNYDLGVEQLRWEYSPQGQMLRESYHGGHGELKKSNAQIAFFEYTLDSAGNRESVRFYDEHSKLVEHPDWGAAIIEYDYSASGDLIRLRFKDSEGRLCHNNRGYAIENLYYDASGREVMREYLSRFKQPVLTTGGLASLSTRYDRCGNAIAELYRDENNELIEDEKGYAIYNHFYNRNGERTNSYGLKATVASLDSIDYGEFNISVNPRFELMAQSFVPGKASDLQTTYYDNGQKRSEGWYIDGKLEGTYTTWYEDGTISSEIEYVNGKRNGLSIDYYKNGKKWRELTYRNNILIVTSEISWHLNGSIKSRYIDGEEVYWDEQGKRLAV